jgi:phage gp45-like
MQRATPVDTSIRAYGAGGARGLVHKADDTQFMQVLKVNYMKYETRDNVEHPQNYGFSSVVREAEYGSDDGSDKPASGQPEKPIKNGAEHFGQFMGGNRAFPVIQAVDDRRYRLFNNKEGEVWVYDDQQQKIQIKRNLILTRSQYKIVHRVIKDEQQSDKTKTRDQSQQDIDDAKQSQGGGQQQSSQSSGSGGGGGGNGSAGLFTPGDAGSGSDSGVEQKEKQDKPWKPLSTYAADKDSVVLIRQKDNDNGDYLSKLWLTSGQGDATPKGEKQQPSGPILEGKFDESKQTINFTVYYPPQQSGQSSQGGQTSSGGEGLFQPGDAGGQDPGGSASSSEQKPQLVFTKDGEDNYVEIQTLDQDGNLTLWFRMDQGGKMITLQALDKGQPKQTIQLDNNKNQIHLFTQNTDVILDDQKKKVLVGDQSANTPAAIRGSVDSKGHRIVCHVATKVLLPEPGGGGGGGGAAGQSPPSSGLFSPGDASGGAGSAGVVEA